MPIHVVVDINFNLPGVLPALKLFEGLIMGKLDELNAKADAVVANTEESNAKTDALILVASTTKDALVALQGQIAGGEVITADQLDGVIAKLDAVLVSQDAQDQETDTAATSVAP